MSAPRAGDPPSAEAPALEAARAGGAERAPARAKAIRAFRALLVVIGILPWALPLMRARLPMGETFLAAWLTEPGATAEIVDRQKLVEELRESVDLREDLAVIGAELRARLNPESLMRWAEKTGAAPLQEVVWAVMPQVATLWTSYTLNRFESSARAATVLDPEAGPVPLPGSETIRMTTEAEPPQGLVAG